MLDGLEQLTVDFGALEFPGVDVVLEKKINLAEGAVLGLGQSIPAPNIAQEIGTGVEQARFRSPIPGCRESEVSITLDVSAPRTTYKVLKACVASQSL